MEILMTTNDRKRYEHQSLCASRPGKFKRNEARFFTVNLTLKNKHARVRILYRANEDKLKRKFEIGLNGNYIIKIIIYKYVTL